MAHIVEPPLDQILRYCAEDPVERVFLEDVARRGLGRFAGVEEDGRLVALCHTGANVVPSGRGCGVFADADRACRGADADRRAAARERPLGGGAAPAARTPRGPARPAGLRDLGPRPSRGRAACGRRSSPTSTCSFRPARAHTRSSSGSTRSRGTPTASAGGRARRSRRAARGSGARTASSSSRPRRPPGRPTAVQLQQVWADPAARGAGNGEPRAARPDPPAARAGAARLPLRPRRQQPAIRLYDTVGMEHVLDYRSVLL